MTDVKMIIGNCIYSAMTEHNKKPEELAMILGKPTRYARNLLNGGYLVRVDELKQISEWLKMPIDELLSVSNQYTKHMGIEALLDKVETEEAREAIMLADKIADMILFHRTVRENSIRMNSPAFTE